MIRNDICRIPFRQFAQLCLALSLHVAFQKPRQLSPRHIYVDFVDVSDIQHTIYNVKTLSDLFAIF
jgi:hypothetical protein